VRLEIEESRSGPGEGEHKPQRSHTLRKALAGAAVVASLLLLIAFVAYVMRPRQAPDMLRFEIDLPHGRTDLGSAISPDGKSLVFVAASTTGDDVLWVRRMETLEATPLSGTEGAYSPFWSPDSGSIAFFALGKLKRVPVTGGAVQTLCDVLSPADVPAGAWGPDGSIIFAQSFGPLHRVSARGGEVVPVTVVNEARQEFGHYYPAFLPDGEHFAYEVGAVPERLGIHVGSLRSADVRQLSPKSLLPFSVTSDGLLLAVEQGVLKAQKLNLRRLRVIDEGVPIANGVRTFSVSVNGRLAYEPASQARTQLTWFNRAGKRLGTVGSPGAYQAPVLSPDETKVAVGRDGDIWVLDLVRGVETRLTSDPAPENWPLWFPDGREVLFERLGSLIRRPSSGAGTEEVLFEGGIGPFGVSADGRFVTYMTSSSNTLGDLYVLPLVGERKAQPFLRNKFQEAENQLSPDGKWMTYDSSESGKYEVYVQAFPSTLERWRISTTGGTQPTWRRDGREMFYLSLDRQLMAVDIETTPHFRAGVPRALFRLAAPTGPVRNSYAPSRRGDRFLVNSYAEDAASTIVILLNWPVALPD
jgi:eukaryotic-like serine/threonine-protein kinase